MYERKGYLTIDDETKISLYDKDFKDNPLFPNN
jgi:hypothetical protein